MISLYVPIIVLVVLCLIVVLLEFYSSKKFKRVHLASQQQTRAEIQSVNYTNSSVQLILNNDNYNPGYNKIVDELPTYEQAIRTS